MEHPHMPSPSPHQQITQLLLPTLCGADSPAITTGRAVTLEQNLPTQPCYKSGSGGSAVRQSLLLRALAPNVLPGTLHGDTEERRQWLGHAAHPGVAAL